MPAYSVRRSSGTIVRSACSLRLRLRRVAIRKRASSSIREATFPNGRERPVRRRGIQERDGACLTTMAATSTVERDAHFATPPPPTSISRKTPTGDHNHSACWLFVGPGELPFAAIPTTNIQRAPSLWSPAGASAFRTRIVANECDDRPLILFTDATAVVLPLLDSLIRNPQQPCGFHLGQPTINAGETEMLAQGAGVCRGAGLLPMIGRKRREMCYKCPTTNTQQATRRLLPASTFPPLKRPPSTRPGTLATSRGGDSSVYGALGFVMKIGSFSGWATSGTGFWQSCPPWLRNVGSSCSWVAASRHSAH